MLENTRKRLAERFKELGVHVLPNRLRLDHTQARISRRDLALCRIPHLLEVIREALGGLRIALGAEVSRRRRRKIARPSQRVAGGFMLSRSE